MGDAAVTTEREFLWGPLQTWQLVGGVIVSTAADSGSTPTTTLRKGLLMGIVTASKKWKQYSPTATDGSQVVQGILVQDYNTLDQSGTARDGAGRFLIRGMVKNAAVLNLDAVARSQMR